MKTTDLDYDLPEALIAQRPCDRRDESRLLVVNRSDGTLKEDVYSNVARYFRRGDCLVLNDTRVIRARLYGRKATGGRVEVFLLREHAPGEWDALVRPSAKVKPGTSVVLESGVSVVVDEVLPEGRRRVRFDRPDVLEILENAGQIPLPPYVKRQRPDDADAERYQTVYARQPGAVAAPTAGLHFTDSVFQSLDAAGVKRAYVTLHVGYGTFKPITAEDLDQHQLEPEDFSFPEESAALLNAVRQAGGRVAAVGTTCTRVLESQCREGRFFADAGSTNHFIYPPYTFRGVDVLQTNFHLPRSSLLALVYAFAGRDLMREAYDYAMRNRFRFYSYGDVMLIV